MSNLPQMVQELQRSWMPQTATSSGAAPVASIADPEALLAQEMSRLSVQERTQALEELHGVADLTIEDPASVDRHLKEFDLEVSRRKNQAYILAECRSKEYVSSREFRLMFLRADCFDIRAAAQRLMNFFERKLTLFGEERLTRDIALEDLSQDDLKFLESGFLQELVDTDRSGRTVYCIFQSQRKHIIRPENLVSLSKY
jgi:hypothetical protein